MDLAVPLQVRDGQYYAGKRKLQLLVDPVPDQVSGDPRRGDGDTLKLICDPVPVP